jgi:fimbrial chaperone protein
MPCRRRPEPGLPPCDDRLASLTLRGPIVRAACVTALLVAAIPAGAATFTVDPTQIYLTAAAASRLVTLRNESHQPIRFQLSVFAWDQDARGEMGLEPTEDVIVFPSLLTLAPGEQRRVRVGVATSFAAMEKTYRLFVEELPPLARPGDTPGGITVLTKMGIPIFLRPGRADARAEIQDVGLRNGVFSFEVRNTGNVHFVPETIRVRGLDPDGRVAFTRQLNGWYILAGGVRRYDLPVPRPECAAVVALDVQVAVAKSTLTAQLQTPPAACSP